MKTRGIRQHPVTSSLRCIALTWQSSFTKQCKHSSKQNTPLCGTHLNRYANGRIVKTIAGPTLELYE